MNYIRYYESYKISTLNKLSDYELTDIDEPIREPQVKTGLKKIHFIILDGKHIVNIKRIKYMLQKLDDFKNYIEKSHNFNPDLHTKEFGIIIEQFHLKEISTNPMCIYFAGPRLAESAIEYITNNEFTNMEINYMKSKDDQYLIYEKDNDYEPVKLADYEFIYF
jgi:hypothetical protein